MASIPQSQARPIIKFEFLIDDLVGKDFGYLFSRLEFKSMVNGGYIVRGQLVDPHLNLLSSLIKKGYLEKSRSQFLPIKFQLKASSTGKPPQTATKEQQAVVLSLNSYGGPGDNSIVEFVAIDPASWHLNAGNASGKSYKGNVSKVIKQVIEEYAPAINLEISETIDNDQNRFWMMRQDPKTFISSIIDWSSSVTRNKTHWLLGMDGNKLIIKEQAELISKQRAFYRFWKGKNDTIIRWELLADNALSIIQTKLVTQGLSAISGKYLDIVTDEKEKQVFVKDTTTTAKQIAKTTKTESFTKPDDSIGQGANNKQKTGWSAVSSLPEVYSAGEMGLSYDEYIDGRPRGIWLNLINNVMRLKVTVLGHGEWAESTGLGIDTVYLKWIIEPDDDGNQLYFYNGNWLVYGFNHIITPGKWNTDLYLARYDYDSVSKKVGGS